MYLFCTFEALKINRNMECRMCGACCIACSISSIIPGLNRGKNGGERCIHLSENNLCLIYDNPERPAICGKYHADKLVCGDSFEEAMQILGSLMKP